VSVLFVVMLRPFFEGIDLQFVWYTVGVIVAFATKLYPTVEQERLLEETLETFQPSDFGVWSQKAESTAKHVIEARSFSELSDSGGSHGAQ
jgi:hypothetical protein